MNNKLPQPKYFEIIRALHRGGLSLWLNRRALFPMTLVPVVVTFLTVMFARGGLPEDASPFILALIQIPANFVIGLFSALIIFIIINAPKKKDKDKPVLFTLNLTEKKGVLLTAAGAHVVFGYFAAGIFGVIQMIYRPIQLAAESNTPPSIMAIVVLFALFFILLYGMRFLILPILIVAGLDIKNFYLWHRSFGLSIPIFAVKAITTMTVGFSVLLISSPILVSVGDDGGAIPTTQMAIVDFATAFGSVLASAWCYACLSIGFRQMVEGKAT